MSIQLLWSTDLAISSHAGRGLRISALRANENRKCNDIVWRLNNEALGSAYNRERRFFPYNRSKLAAIPTYNCSRVLAFCHYLPAAIRNRPNEVVSKPPGTALIQFSCVSNSECAGSIVSTGNGPFPTILSDANSSGDSVVVADMSERYALSSQVDTLLLQQVPRQGVSALDR
jgi:hypothetical protein